MTSRNKNQRHEQILSDKQPTIDLLKELADIHHHLGNIHEEYCEKTLYSGPAVGCATIVEMLTNQIISSIDLIETYAPHAEEEIIQEQKVRASDNIAIFSDKYRKEIG